MPDNHSKRKLEKLLREAGIEPSIRDIGNDMLEFSIPIYDDTMLSGTIYAGIPITGNVSNEKKREIVFDLSSFVKKIAEKIIFYSIDNLSESLKFEQNVVAFAFLQRAAISHICNHKLSYEGISTEYRGKKCIVVDEYKTMPLTRSVYEHLVMFYYLFIYPSNQNQREIVWQSWMRISKSNQTRGDIQEFEKERQKATEEFENIQRSIKENELAKKCLQNPNGHLNDCLKSNSVFSIEKEGDVYVAQKLTYDRAWRYLYGEDVDFSFTYSYLSWHSHPTYIGLAQFNSQEAENIEFSLYDSCRFLAYLCRLYMKQLQIDYNAIFSECSSREQGIFSSLSDGKVK